MKIFYLFFVEWCGGENLLFVLLLLCCRFSWVFFRPLTVLFSQPTSFLISCQPVANPFININWLFTYLPVSLTESGRYLLWNMSLLVSSLIPPFHPFPLSHPFSPFCHSPLWTDILTSSFVYSFFFAVHFKEVGSSSS